jgi:hypothetical protein
MDRRADRVKCLRFFGGGGLYGQRDSGYYQAPETDGRRLLEAY